MKLVQNSPNIVPKSLWEPKANRKTVAKATGHSQRGAASLPQSLHTGRGMKKGWVLPPAFTSQISPFVDICAFLLGCPLNLKQERDIHQNHHHSSLTPSCPIKRNLREKKSVYGSLRLAQQPTAEKTWSNENLVINFAESSFPGWAFSYIPED